MSAAQALKVAAAAGVSVRLDDSDLVLEASTPPPTVVLDLLSRCKPGIVALLGQADDRWTAKDWQVYFDERAGIAEFDGRVSRPEAEAVAFASCIDEYRRRRAGTTDDAVVTLAAAGIGKPANLPNDFDKIGGA